MAAGTALTWQVAWRACVCSVLIHHSFLLMQASESGEAIPCELLLCSPEGVRSCDGVAVLGRAARSSAGREPAKPSDAMGSADDGGATAMRLCSASEGATSQVINRSSAPASGCCTHAAIRVRTCRLHELLRTDDGDLR